MKIPESGNTIQTLIDAEHKDRKESPRTHMGCSQLGHPCDRWVWLSFRWAVREDFPGRILRLFRRGHNEEATIISDLRAIGMDIRCTQGEQTRVDFGGHVSGSLDAIIESGVPEAPKARHVAEFKTHSKKSFDDVRKKGVQESKPMHFVQMQVYMHGSKIDRALYLAVCKDDDRIYTERVRYDKEVAEKAVSRGHRLALADSMPEPLSADPSWYQCKFCAGMDICHGSKLTKQVNCRTCAHSTAMPDSTWHCGQFDAGDIPTGHQRTGCDFHVLHPDLVPWKRKESPNNHSAVYVVSGVDVVNGSGGYASSELIANAQACADGLKDPYLADFPDAMVVG